MGIYVCFSLDHVKVHSSAFYGSGNGSILLDDLKCAGNETQIDQCNHSPWLVNNCGHNEDVGVNCGNYLEILTRPLSRY